MTPIGDSLFKIMSSAHGRYLSVCISVFQEALTNNVLETSLEDAVTEWFTKSFFKTSINPIDLPAFPAAARIVLRQSLTNDRLSPILAALHFNRVPFAEGGINTADAFDFLPVDKRTFRLTADSNAFAPVRHAVIQVIYAVAIDHVGRIKHTVGIWDSVIFAG
jgi:hypothetical protein